MPSRAVNALLAPRPAARYATLARLLTAEIESGRYKVGGRFPTEAELQRRFDASRHTVREALRDLKARGLLLARAGVGTVVRAKTPKTRFMQGIGTLKELIPFVAASRMRVLGRRETIADAALEIGRQYFDAQDRIVTASEGLYPSDRFSHNTKFRIQSE